MSKVLSIVTALVLAPAALAAQTADSTDYLILRGADTVAAERVFREGVKQRGELTVFALRNRLTLWSMVLGPDGAAALVEATETEAPPDPRMKARILHRTRVIFKADSAALDDLTDRGMLTNIYPTKEGALPYFNLSVGALETTVKQALSGGKSKGEVPLFNMGGAQTVMATVEKTGESSAMMQIGSVAYTVQFDDEGRITEAAVPAQQLRMTQR